MTERESYTIKSIELHLFLGQIILKQISALSPAENYNALSSFEKKYKTLLSKTAQVGNCLFSSEISLDCSQEIKYINQDVLLLLQKLICVLENVSLPVLEWEIHFYRQCLFCLETESTHALSRYWIKQICKSEFS